MLPSGTLPCHALDMHAIVHGSASATVAHELSAGKNGELQLPLNAGLSRFER